MKKYRYNDITKQSVYENSKDCLIYGYGFAYLNRCGLSEEEARTIWNQAMIDLASKQLEMEEI